MTKYGISGLAFCLGALLLWFGHCLCAQEITQAPPQREKQLQACRRLDPKVFPVETCAAIMSQLSPDDELGMVFVGGDFEVARRQPDGTMREQVLLLPPELRSRIALNGVKETIREHGWGTAIEPGSTLLPVLQRGRDLWSRLRDVYCHFHPHQGYRDLSETVQTCSGGEPMPDEKTMEEEFDGAVVFQTDCITWSNAKQAERELAQTSGRQVTKPTPPSAANCIPGGQAINCYGKPLDQGTSLHQVPSPSLDIQEPTAPNAPAWMTGPDLRKTISFMNSSVQPEQSYVTSANRCEVEILRHRLYNFAIPIESYLKSTDELGIRHYGFKWQYAHEPEMTRFNLATIDPKSIKSQAVPSPDFVKAHGVDENLSFLKYADLMVVRFEAANSASSIETGHLPPLAQGEVAKVDTPVWDDHRHSGFVVFESKDRAERFVTAFVHAVELCGGRDSDFAPTPTKP